MFVVGRLIDLFKLTHSLTRHGIRDNIDALTEMMELYRFLPSSMTSCLTLIDVELAESAVALIELFVIDSQPYFTLL